jgi:hypothetical protein
MEAVLISIDDGANPRDVAIVVQRAEYDFFGAKYTEHVVRDLETQYTLLAFGDDETLTILNKLAKVKGIKRYRIEVTVEDETRRSLQTDGGRS